MWWTYRIRWGCKSVSHTSTIEAGDTEIVSTSARTLKRPPDSWQYTTFEDTLHYWGGSPQGLTADFLHEGATGAAGNAYEPLLVGCAHPDYVIPAYFKGRNLAES